MEKINLLILTLIVLLIPQFKKIFFSLLTNNKKIFILTKKDIFFNFIKGLAIIAVIIIHICFFYCHYFPELKNNFFFVALNNISRFAIPLFFICSGILLNPEETKNKLLNFYLKKIIRIFIPYIIISILINYFLFHNSFLISLYNIISGRTLVPYYFIIVLLQFYILYPVLVYLKDKRCFLPTSFVISLICFLFPQCYQFYGVYFFGKFFFLFAYGVSQRNYFLDYTPNKKYINFWKFIIVLYITIMIILYYYKPNNNYYYNTRIFFGLAVFNILFYYRNIILTHKKLVTIVANFGEISLWIFLFHFLVMSIIFQCLIKNINIIFGVPIFFILSLLISYIIGKIFFITYSQIYKINKMC